MNARKFIEKNKLIFYFVVILAISWSIWIPMAFDYLDIIEFKIPLIVGSMIGAFGPLITIIILEKITNKVVDVNEIFASIWKRKSKIIWFLLAALAFPLLTIASNIKSIFILFYNNIKHFLHKITNYLIRLIIINY